MIRFDTLDKKPKVYDLLAVALVLICVYAFLIFKMRERSAVIIGFLQIGYFCYVLARLIIAFVRQLRYNPYSYNCHLKK